MNERTSSERVHISFFGRRNAGKSSLVNAVTNQELAVVSDVLGTTTDPVKKSMELLPIGPVVIIDTAGTDDDGELGGLRVKKTREILGITDIAVLVVDSTIGISSPEEQLIELFEEKNITYVIAYNKSDLLSDSPVDGIISPPLNAKKAKGAMNVSSATGFQINEFKDMIGALAKEAENIKPIVTDLLNPGDTCVLVIPIDSSAPKNRIILPQQQVLSELLTFHCKVVCCQPEEVTACLKSLKEVPSLVITDSQAFKKVAADVPKDIRLTSFSILFARYKGNLSGLMKGASVLKTLQDNDLVLISEACTHHRQCEDIGTVKMPGWIEAYTGVKPRYEFSSGNSFPENLSDYKLVIHCGGCMLNETAMQSRMRHCKEAGVPVVNYGIAIATMNGILDRSTEMFN